MDAIANWVGYIVMMACAVCVVAGAVLGAAWASNKAQHAAVDSVGGWKTFCEYREWFHGDRKDGERMAFLIRKDWEQACGWAKADERDADEAVGTLDEYAKEWRETIDRAMNAVTHNCEVSGLSAAGREGRARP